MKIYTLLCLCLLTFSLTAQDFKKQWKEVIELEKTERIKTALTVVEQIEKKARKTKKETQLIRVFFYKSKFLQRLDEDAQSKIITNLQIEIENATPPSQAILNYIYAICLNDYLNYNRYKISERTPTEGEETKEFLQWSRNQIENEIQSAIQKSISNPQTLKKTSIAKYKDILDNYRTENIQDENLYEFLIDKYIDFHKGSLNLYSNYLTSFIEKNKKDFYSKTEVFTNINTDSISDPSLKNTLKFHQLKEGHKPLPENQFERMQFLHNYVFKDVIDFIHTLDNFQNELQDTVLIQKVQLEKARLYETVANKKTNPDALIKSRKILDSILNNNIDHFTNKLATYQKQNILNKSLSVSLNQYSYEGENTRAHISYKNVDSLFIKYYKVPALFNFDHRSQKNDSIMASIVESRASQLRQTISLPPTENYFETTTQILLPKLPKGKYVILFEAEKNSFQNKEAYSYTTVTVSNLAVLHHEVTFKYPERDKVFQIIDRKKGTPIRDVNLHYNADTLKTDKNGLVHFKTYTNNYNTTQLLVHKSGDSLYLPLNHWTQTLNSKDSDEVEEDIMASVKFFSDRGIYRPGQTAHVKGIALKRQNGEVSVVPGVKFYIEITDPQGNEVKEFDIRTNEYGSFNFEFQIPQNGLTGNYSVSVYEGLEIENDDLYDKRTDEHSFWDNAELDYSYFNFSVEEYKRPTFHVKMDAVSEAYSLNDSIKFHGTATAFSGANISNSKVVYRVERQVYTHFRYGMPSSSLDIISEGETTTDADGKIIIPFKAIPDESYTKESLPVFTYTAHIDVTDINGETQSGQQSVRLGYHSLLLNAEIDKDLYLDPSKKIILSSTNLNGDFVPVQGKLRVYFQKKLQPEFIEPRFPSAEKPLISEEEFAQLFPYEKKAGSETSEENGELILSKDINTEVQTEVDLDFLRQQPQGHYRIIFSAFDKEEEIKSVTDFRLLNKKEPIPDELFTITQKNLHPYDDKQLNLEIRSQVPDLFVNIQGLDVNKYSPFYEEHINLKNGILSLKIPFDKNIPEDVVFQVEAFFENHFFNKEIRIIKPEINSLDVEVISMRNKLDPGSNEIWSFKIAQDNKAAEAEVLTSMYDQSLDEFRVLNWEKPDLQQNNYYYSTSDQKDISTQKRTFSLKNLNPYLFRPSLSFPQIDIQWFGFSFGTVNNYERKNSYERWSATQQNLPVNANTVYGYVTDDAGLPLPGVNVVIEGTNRGTQTDFDGYYEIEVASGEELVFTYVGFATQGRVVPSVTPKLDVQMEPGEELSQVVVTGFAVKREKKALGYAVSQINEEYDEDAIARTLSGKTSGVVITNAQGKAGSATNINIRGYNSVNNDNKPLLIIDGVVQKDYDIDNIHLAGIAPSDIESIEEIKGFKAAQIYGSEGRNGVLIITTKKGLEALTQVQTRKNFQETAFFYPNLKTNKKGEIQFDFTTPEALTTWKFRLLAHNKKGQTGYLEKTAITQKDLMISPNMPRFLREMDTITITARIANITAESKSGTALLQLYNAVNMEPMETNVILSKNIQEFQAEPKGNTIVSWRVAIPKGIQGIQYKIVAKSGNFTDGEENILPVLTNSLLVTESISMWVREKSKKEFSLQNLKDNHSTTLQNHQLTFEYTANPVWLAIKALPYLMEFEHNCSEQTFARFYANKLAIKILNDNPEIAMVFEKWKNDTKPLSKLAQNEELKNILLAETPWLLDSESEEERNNRVALLFDLNTLSQNSDVLIDKLIQMQAPSGGFPWFQGGYENVNITQHILSGLAKLENQNIELPASTEELILKGIRFADADFSERHARRENSEFGFKITNTGVEIDYLYFRSFYIESYPFDKKLKDAADIYLKNIVSKWPDLDLQRKAKAAIILHRFGNTSEAKIIINGLRETSALNDESGLYWISNKPGWHWHQSPIENQALLINAFDEVEKDTASVEMMKVWLLKNKQTKSWATTKATTEAIYALLNFGKNPLKVVPDYNIQIGKDNYNSSDLKEINPTAGSGYIKITYSEEEITNSKSDIIIENNSALPGFGGIYWQYFEELDKIKPAPESLFQIQKELFIKRNTPTGQQLQKINSTNKLQIGDILTVKMIIETKEDVEYVHLKDMRASGLEPVQVISLYQWKDGLGYYQSTRDAATHFFFDKIDRGTYIIEYDLRVNNTGNFSNGITTIQSMYAPEFSHHTEGIRLQTE